MAVSRLQHLRERVDVVRRSLDVMKEAGLAGRPADGIRSALAVRKFGSFAGIFQSVTRNHPSDVALVDELGELTYAQLNGRINALARAWTASGVGPDTVIAALCRDHRWLIITMAAAGKTGATLLLMNTGFGAPQLADVARREGVTHLVHDEEFRERLAAIDPSVQRYLAWEETAGTATAMGVPTVAELVAAHSTAAVPPPPRPGSFVLLTSGTTGTPKGAPREKTSPLAAAQLLDRIPVRSGESTFMAAPIFHGTGLSQAAMTWALAGKVVMHRRFDAAAVVRDVEAYRCTTLVVVPTMLHRILNLGDEVFDRHDLSHLRILFSAGSALNPETVRQTFERFGPVLHNLYGSTECAVATVAMPEDLAIDPRTAGRPPVGCTVRLYDDGRREITTPGVTGRIFAGSGLAFGGYTDGTNKEVIDGLLSTGDVGHFDEDGLLYIDGRDDDMIVCGGENVFPIEVEHLLADRDDIAEAAVVGVPDEEFGQRLRAFVVLQDGANQVDEDEIRQYVKANLARHKVPRDVVFLDELPRNATGKLLRRQLV